MRFIYLDGSGEAIAGSEQLFKVTVNAPAEETVNKCANAELTFKTKSRDIPLAFNATNGDNDY
jgi:hypothetical protein